METIFAFRPFAVLAVMVGALFWFGRGSKGHEIRGNGDHTGGGSSSD